MEHRAGRPRVLTRRMRSDERGIALVTVIGVGAALAILTAVIAMQSLTNIKQVREQKSNEQALQVADAGIDATLYQLNASTLYNTGETAPAFATKDAEKAWVLDKANTAAASWVIKSPGGEWVAVKPVNGNITYSVGYVPTRAAPQVTRVIRVDYDYGSATIDYAILAGGSLALPYHTDIKSGSVHTNGDLAANSGGSKGKIDGSLSASGTYSLSSRLKPKDLANSGGGTPTILPPDIRPRDFYWQAQYDLCPDGKIRPGPAYTGPEGPNTSGTPCQGAGLLANLAGNSGIYRGWRYTGNDSANKGGMWEYPNNKKYDGVYYVYQGSAKITAKKVEKGWNATIMAEATGACPFSGVGSQIGGDVEINNGQKKWEKWNYYPTASPFLVIAGRDFLFSQAHLHKLVGVIIAREQFYGGTKHLEIKGGSLVASSYCDTPVSYNPSGANVSNAGHPHITYTHFDEIPIDRIRAIQWQEL